MAAAAAFLSAAQPAFADVSSDWAETAAKALEDSQKPGQPGSLIQARARAETALALFEAVNAVNRRYRSYVGLKPAAPGASAEAAAASAAHAVLSRHFPDQAVKLDAALKTSLGPVPDGPGEAAGIAAGKSAAEAVLALERVDRRMTETAYRPATTPGVYVPTALPVLAPWRLTMKPFFLDRCDQFRPGPPPALTSAAYARDLDEVRRLGAKDSKERTPYQTASAGFWAGMDINPALRQVADVAGRRLVDNARMYALVNMASHDAFIAMTDAKMHYGYWRPITAIRNADQDGNERTERVAGWEPLLNTPMHPEYVCGHCIGARTTAAVMTGQPNPPGGLAFIDRDAPHAPRTVRDWDEYAVETSMSRIYAGVHYRFSNDAGEAMGRKVADLALRKFAPPLASAQASTAR
jgi:hypothetical protein